MKRRTVLLGATIAAATWPIWMTAAIVGKAGWNLGGKYLKTGMKYPVLTLAGVGLAGMLTYASWTHRAQIKEHAIGAGGAVVSVFNNIEDAYGVTRDTARTSDGTAANPTEPASTEELRAVLRTLEERANEYATQNATLRTQLATYAAAPLSIPHPPEFLYRVERGDTLSAIAHRFCGNALEYHAIVAANELTDPDMLVQGTELALPVPPCAPHAALTHAAK